MYCKYCGAKLKEDADVCVKCGKLIKENKVASKEKVKIPGRGLSIAGMIIGIFSILVAIGEFSDFDMIEEELSFGYYYFEVFASIVEYVFFDFALPIVGLVLSVIGFMKNKNGFNITGIILNTISILLIALLFIVLLTIY